MKKKALALLLAAAMAIQPLSVAGAAEFTDGQQMDVKPVEEAAEEPVEVFTDDAAEEPVVEEEKAEESSVAPSETAIQMGDDVWAEFDDATSTATISGTGDMWDYLDDGATLDNKHKNPFRFEITDVNKIIFGNEVTHISDYLFYWSERNFHYGHGLKEVILGDSIQSIGKCAFYCEPDLNKINFTATLETIGEMAFSMCRNLDKVELGNNLKFLGAQAFSECDSLQVVELSKSLTEIPEFCFFRNMSLKKIVIPDGVKTIKYGAFDGCSKLNDVTLQEGMERLEHSIFRNCIRLQEITLPQSVNEMPMSIFEGCTNLKTIRGYTCSVAKKYYDSLPEEQKQRITFESIGEGTHEWSNEAEIIKYPTCEESGEKAFKCNICGAFSDNKTIIPASGHNWSEWTTTKEPTETEMGEKQHTCYNCGKVDTQNIPKLSPIRFYEQYVGWKNYDELRISAELNKPVYFYVECKKADDPEPKFDESKLDKTIKPNDYIQKEIVVSEEPITVYLFVQDKDGNYTHTTLEPYYGNRPEKPATTIKVGDNITATIEGDTLTLTGSGATYDYGEGVVWYNADKSHIKQVIFDGKITRIGDYFFKDFKGLEKIAFPEGITELREDVLTECTGLKEILFPSTLKVIPCLGDAMDEDGFPNLETVVIPEGVSTIGECALNGCPKLTSITLPNSITNLERGSFSYTGITELDLPEKITKIPSHFLDSSAIENIILPESVTEIGYSAFEKCSNLEEIFIPQNVAYIAKNVLGDCRNAYIKGYKDSVAERYALANAIPFVSVDYKVVFKEDGRAVGEPQYIPKNGNATPPTLTPRPGYTLSWDADYTNITEDMVINAVWTKDGADKPEPPIIVYPPSETKYTVTFKDRGKVIKTEKVVSGEAADFPYISRYGYELSWDKDFSKVTSNMTVNAVWTVIKPVKVTSMTAEVLPKYARLSWDETEFTSYYLVYRKAEADKEFKQVAKTTRVLWNDKKVKPGNEYQYKVAAVRSVEGKKYQGEYSDTVTVKIGKPETGDIYSVGKLNYKIMNSNEVRVTGLAKDTARLSIPTSVSIVGKSYKVTSIDHKAFYRNVNLIDVKIGNNVTYVGKYAFYQCPNLETVKFGGRVQTISTCAFTQCPKLGNVVLPSSVERLGAKAFFKCTSMRIMTVKTSRLNYLGTKAFAINPKVTIRVPKSKYSAYVKMIKKSGRYASTKYQKF